jgi:hypothetical protein
VSSCFSQLLNLHNLSEEISNAQLERAVRVGEVISQGLSSAKYMPFLPIFTFLYFSSMSRGFTSHFEVSQQWW